MKLSVEALGKIAAQARNYASMFVGFIGGVGIISAAQSKGLTDSLTEIANGISQIVHGASSIWQILLAAFPFLTIWFANLAGKSAKTESQAAAIAAAANDPVKPISSAAKDSIVTAAVIAAPEKVSVK